MSAGVRVWAMYLARRVGAVALVLFGVATITFVVSRMLGTPVYLLVGSQASPEVIEATTRQLGLDRPLPEQYVTWLGALVRGDLGLSRQTFNPVTVDIALRLPATLELVVAALVITVLIAVPLGILAAIRPRSLLDHVGQTVGQIGASLPNFWLGLIFLYVFVYTTGWFPPPLGRLGGGVTPPGRITGMLVVDSVLTGNGPALSSALSHLALPAFTLALLAVPATLQITRGTLLQILDSNYIRTARAYGAPPLRLYGVYALRNALVPLMTVLAMSFGFLMSGTVLIEYIFAWPGIGLYAVDSMNNFDYEPVVAVVLLGAAFYAVAYLVADLLSFAVDARLRIDA